MLTNIQNYCRNKILSVCVCVLYFVCIQTVLKVSVYRCCHRHRHFRLPTETVPKFKWVKAPFTILLTNFRQQSFNQIDLLAMGNRTAKFKSVYANDSFYHGMQSKYLTIQSYLCYLCSSETIASEIIIVRLRREKKTYTVKYKQTRRTYKTIHQSWNFYQNSIVKWVKNQWKKMPFEKIE